MCGIHAVFNVDTQFNNNATKYMEQAFIVNSLRGVDSSGMFVVNDKGQQEVHKMALQGPLFVESKLTKRMLTDVGRCRVAVGHVRAATAGKINVDNSHPFVGYGPNGSRVVGVHNGTLNDWRSNTGAGLYEVDSDWAIQHIADENADAFEDFHGAYAFIWWREETPGKVFVARNDQRPMHMLVTPDEKTMYLGSELGMVSWLTDRNSIKAKDNAIYQIEAGMLYEFDLTGAKITYKKSALPKAVPRRPTYSSSTYAGSSPKSTSFGASAAKIMDAVNEIIDTEAAGAQSPTTAKTSESSTVVVVPTQSLLSRNEAPKMSKAEKKRIRREERAKRERMLKAVAEGGEEYTLPDGWYKATLSTHNEKSAAKSAGIYGQLTPFKPTHFEPELGDLYGVIDEYVQDMGRVEYDAVMRNITSHKAYRLTYGEEDGWGAIIGLGKDNNGQQYVIVGELSEEGVEGLKAVS